MLLGPPALVLPPPLWLERVEEAELVAQLPEVPVTPDGALVCCVLAELLQLYAFTKLDVFVSKSVVATKNTIALIIRDRFMFVSILVTNRYNLS